MSESMELLKKEVKIRPEGKFFPKYFKYLGYRSDLAADSLRARTNALRSLFTLPEPNIYKNDIIAGSLASLFVNKDSAELEYAEKITDSFSERAFCQNCDHFSPDYRSVVSLGISGLCRKIDSSAADKDPGEREYLGAMKECLTAFSEMLRKYSRRASALRGTEGYDDEKLSLIETNCKFIAENPPETFSQALQLIWMCHVAFCMEGRYAMALGRLDQYLYPFYRKDMEQGILTDASAQEMLENVFVKIAEARTFRGGDDVVNICIGGMNEKEACEVNELSFCILRAVKACRIPGPNLSARIAPGTPDVFLDECLKVIGTGLGYPALMNDRVNIAALKKFGYEEKDVYDYSMVGCLENFITGKQPPWSDGRFDTPRFFEYMFNRGCGIVHPSVGIDTGDVSEIHSMDEFMKKFELQLEYGVREYYALFANDNARLNPRRYAQPFLSCFCSGCIEKGRDICDGGSKYPSVHGAALMGVGTVADSLAAIEKVVFEYREASLSELGSAIKNNFEGAEDLRRKLAAAPKYGNNDDFADKYACWFVEFLSSCFRELRTPDGGGIYVAMAANIANISAGKMLAATPDGRKARQPISDAASPTYGVDTRGPTSTVNSLTKPDYTNVACGTVVNQKFSPSAFEDGKRARLLALVKVYFAKGGQEIQINATSREVLTDAMEHPENYGSLVVRVSGFSAYYVTLDRDVQLDILSRTQLA